AEPLAEKGLDHLCGEEAFLRAEHDMHLVARAGEDRACNGTDTVVATLGVDDDDLVAGRQLAAAEAGSAVGGGAAEPATGGNLAGEGEIGPASPAPGPDGQSLTGAERGDLPGAAGPAGMLDGKAAAGNGEADAAALAAKDQPAEGDLDGGRAGRTGEGG